MITNIIPFNFDKTAIRVISLAGGPWFVAKDVAGALGYNNPRNAINRHCKRISTAPKRSGGFMNIILESDVYHLLICSLKGVNYA